MRGPIIALIALLAASACAGGGTAAAPESTIDVTMKEFAFGPQTITLRAGQEAKLRLTNRGKIEHELMVGRQRMTAGGFMEDFFQGLDVSVSGKPYQPADVDHGMAFTLAPGATMEVIFVPRSAAGTWEFGCFLPGHYEAGMKGTLTVR